MGSILDYRITKNELRIHCQTTVQVLTYLPAPYILIVYLPLLVGCCYRWSGPCVQFDCVLDEGGRESLREWKTIKFSIGDVLWANSYHNDLHQYHDEAFTRCSEFPIHGGGYETCYARNSVSVSRCIAQATKLHGTIGAKWEIEIAIESKILVPIFK